MNGLITIPEDRSQFVQKWRTVIQKFLFLLYCGKMMVNLVSFDFGNSGEVFVAVFDLMPNIA